MKRQRLFLIIPAIAITLFAFSCSKDTEGLVATVNGTDITTASLDSRMESVKMQYAGQGRADAYESADDFRADVLDNMIENTLLLNYANENGYAISEETLKSEFDGIAEQFGSPEEFASALETQGLTEETLKEEIRTAYTVENMLEGEITSQLSISDEDVEQFYTENPEYFQMEESVTASHIIVMVDSEATDEEKEEARGKIEAIREEIVNGADFAAVARERSEGPSASSGGSLGTFTRGQMVAPFEEAAFSLEPGELSDIVVTEFGYHIILVEEKIPPRTQPLEQVSPDIREYLKSVSTQEETNKLIDELKANAEIEYYE